MGHRLIGLLAGAFFVLAPSVADTPSGDAIKAGFVYNFSKFVEWPSGTLQAAGQLRLCVAGQALGGKLGALHGRQSQGFDIRVRGDMASGDLSGCHILFIGASEARRLGALLDGVGDNPVLTISDLEDFTASGGMIGLFVQNDRVRFAINLSAIRAAGLKPSSQLLRLGKVVQ